MDPGNLGVTSVSRNTTNPFARTTASAAPATPASDAAAGEAFRAADAGSGIAAVATPKPLRFPWLSRLSEELGAAAKQKPAFPAVQVLGDNLDKSA